jgi:hypothetical protein
MPRSMLRNIGDRISRHLLGQHSLDTVIRDTLGIPRNRRYQDFADSCLTAPIPDSEYPVVLPNWDNTSRSGANGAVLKDSSPEAFAGLLRRACRLVKSRPSQRRLIFIKAWNEWAEGNYLEPDRRFGTQYLLALKEVLDSE